MSYKTHAPGASRFFDHLYDPLFTTSGARNYYQYNYAALSMSAKTQIIPIYGTMFTDLPSKPRSYYVPVRNPLPHYSYYAGGDRETTLAIDKYTLVGAQRYKYFSQPIDVSNVMGLPPITDQIEEESDQGIYEKFREIGCQTMYRVSSAQTKPWMPQAIIAKTENEIPEVVYVADLIKSDKLPGEVEAEIVERARKRRAWEKSLDIFKATKDWNKKRDIIQAFEWEQWVARENEIEECQKLRLKIVANLVDQREQRNKQASQIRVALFNERVLKEKDQKLANMKIKYQREMRKLVMKHNKISKKYEPIDIANEHINRASDLYGPQLRFGKHPRQQHHKLFKTEYEPNFDNINRIEMNPTQIRNIMQTKDKLWKPKQKVKTVQRSFWTDSFLTNLYNTLKQLRQTHDAVLKAPKQPKCVEKILKVTNYITHLTKKREAPESDIEYQSIVYIQKIVKGRAVQNILFRGRNKCRDLIAELQSVIQLSDVGALYPSQSNTVQKHKELVLHQQCKEENLEHLCDQIKEIPTQADSSYMYFLFDFLGKEMVRLEEQRKSHALYLLAEEERYKREAAEAGLRQVENFQREEYDEIYRQIVRSSHDTVETYLENALTEGIEKIAEQEAIQNIRLVAQRIDTLANSMIGNEDRSTVEEIVTNFVFPEVYKQRAREQQQLKRQRHLLAAHMALYEVVDHLPFIAPTAIEIVTKQILNDLIDELIPKTPLSELSINEDPAEHEAHRVINQAIDSIGRPEDDSTPCSSCSSSQYSSDA